MAEDKKFKLEIRQTHTPINFGNLKQTTAVQGGCVSRFVMVEDQPCVTYDSTHDVGLVFDHDKTAHTSVE